MMKNYDQSVEINHNPDWPYILDHPYRTLIIGGSGSGKTNVLLNDKILINLFICKRAIRIKVSITYQCKRKSTN